MVLVSERDDVGDGGTCEVDDGEGVVLLQRYPRRGRGGLDGHVLGLEILGDSGTRAEDAHAGSTQRIGPTVERREAGGADVVLSHILRATGDVDGAHRPLGVTGISLAVAGRLALVGNHDLRAVGSKGQHVG